MKGKAIGLVDDGIAGLFDLIAELVGGVEVAVLAGLLALLGELPDSLGGLMGGGGIRGRALEEGNAKDVEEGGGGA